jgi:hypothetical protein
VQWTAAEAMPRVGHCFSQAMQPSQGMQQVLCQRTSCIPPSGSSTAGLGMVEAVRPHPLVCVGFTVMQGAYLPLLVGPQCSCMR